MRSLWHSSHHAHASRPSPRPVSFRAVAPAAWHLPGVVILVVFALLALAGCMHVDRALTFNGDGSGIYVLTVGFREPKSGDQNSLSAGVVTTMDAFGAHVQQQGGTFRRYDDQSYAYWEYRRPFTSLSQADTFLQEDPRQDDPNHTPLLYADSLHVATGAGFGTSSIHVSGTISLLDPDGKSPSWKDATERLAITMANGISAHDGGAQDNDTVTYTIHYNESASVDVTGNVKNGFPGCGGSAALALVAVGVWLLRSVARSAAAR